jgi:hypothetical protein
MMNELYANGGFVVTQEVNGFAVFEVRGRGDAQQISLLHWFGPDQKNEAIEAAVERALELRGQLAYIESRHALERAPKGEHELIF